ncbi:MAG TPA: serine hydrolase [Thermoanaerobaculia bacterium]|nr:serine hydrolase [Thermoanaerobaculia bacterium]
MRAARRRARRALLGAAFGAMCGAVLWAVAPTSAIPHSYVEYTVPRAASPAGKAADPQLPAYPDAASAGLDRTALTHLMLRAELFHSDAVVVLKDGRLVSDARFGKPPGPIEAGSITKSVAGLAIGRLLYTGKIRSLDEPVADWYPEWRGGPKREITLRQLMNHTSGLAAQPTPEEVYASPNLVRQALAADLASPPGSRFFYNNKAVNLLAGIVEKASGRKLDEYLRDELFAPLGIARFAWMRDPAGNPHVLAGLRLDARDLARIGQLMLDEGVYDGQRLLAAVFVRESVHAAQPFSPTGGLLWWMIPEWTRLVIDRPLLDTWRRGGADPALLAALAPLAGREIPREELFTTLDRAFGHEKALTLWVDNVPARNLPTPKVTAGPPIGFDASGALGQYLVVLPAARLVAVRQLRQHPHRATGDDFEDFPDLVRALVPAPSASSARR